MAAVVIVSLFAALLYGLANGRNGTRPTSTITPVATASASATASPSVTPTPSPSPSPSPTASPTAPPEPGSVLWQQSVSGTVTSQPAVDNGVVFFGTNDKHLWALNTQTGTTVWTVATANPVEFSVVVANGIVVVNEEDTNSFANTIAAYSESNGSLVWRARAPAAGYGPPSVADGAVIADLYSNNGGAALLNAFELTSGKQLWSVTLPGSNTSMIMGHSSPPAIDGGVAYVAETTGGAGASILYAVRISDSTLVWHTAVQGNSAGAANGDVYVGGTPATVEGRSADLAKVDEATGKVVWYGQVNGVGAEGLQTPAIANGVVYIATDTGILYAIDAVSAHQDWSYQVGGNIMSAPVVSGGAVYIGPYNGGLFALDAASGTERWHVGFGGGLTTVANGVAYVGGGAAMYALRA